MTFKGVAQIKKDASMVHVQTNVGAFSSELLEQ
jgi:hypothetical protein